ncbi:MAG TPA: DEAD/DEAH box helicase [Anaerolineales bacterium]|nr:DEAD/DEAH box helicase [Anaerolineales bacterium]
MSVASQISAWRADPSIGDNISFWQQIPARPASLTSIPDDLPEPLKRSLQRQGIASLYSHQLKAYRLARSGSNVALVTGTASGKSLAYNLPVLAGLLNDPRGRALYLFPTKALAQDQLTSLKTLLNLAGDLSVPLPAPAIYDGDTPTAQRALIRQNAQLLLSNPDMLHMGILPHHTSWAGFFENLRYVVLDEIHTYRGVFGSHIANVLRRLMRVAAHYGSRPQFLLTSATIANPQEHASRLIEAPVSVVAEDGSARGPKHFLLYNPPIIDPRLGLRRSALQEAVRLSDDLLTAGVQTIVFARSRRTVEIVLTYLREKATPAGGWENEQETLELRGYRSGYLPGMRRQIEAGLRRGDVRAVVATNALELGIDIGQLGAAVLVGYPGSIASTWQQAGRAGRGSELSAAVLVATPAPLDQYLATHPEYLFERSPEQALIDPDNPLILLSHLRCAAFELPFRQGEKFGSLAAGEVAEYLEFLASEGILHASNDRFYWMADQYPAQQISLRNASPSQVLLQAAEPGDPENLRTIGQIDQGSALWMVHPNAVYLHESQTYFVEELDLEHGQARLAPFGGDYYTLSMQDTQVQKLSLTAEAAIPGGLKASGELQVTTRVTGFRKIRWHTHEVLGVEPLDLPPSELQTTGYWITLSDECVAGLREAGLWTNDSNDYGPDWDAIRQLVRQRDDYRCQGCGMQETNRAHDVHHLVPFRQFASVFEANQLNNLVSLCPSCHKRAEAAVRMRSGLAGLSYVMSNLAPIFLMCDTSDLGAHSDPQSPISDNKPVVVVYDMVPAGIGLSQRLYESHSALIAAASELIQSCACEDGCPSCVGPGGEQGSGSKQATLAILESLQASTNP